MSIIICTDEYYIERKPSVCTAFVLPSHELILSAHGSYFYSLIIAGLTVDMIQKLQPY